MLYLLWWISSDEIVASVAYYRHALLQSVTSEEGDSSFLEKIGKSREIGENPLTENRTVSDPDAFFIHITYEWADKAR